MRQAGFTLLELLIAMTLLGLVMVMLYTSLNMGAKSWDFAENKSAETAEMRDAYQFIQRQINRMRPVSPSNFDDQRKFVGKENTLQFISLAPDNIGISGSVIQQLEVEDADEGVLLRLKSSMDHADAEWQLMANEDEEGYVLFSGANEIEFGYFGAKKLGERANWFDTWEREDNLPELIRLTIVFPDEHPVWPVLLAKVMVDSQSQSVFSGRGGADIPLPSGPGAPGL
jgi:general secretion pathway protein J